MARGMGLPPLPPHGHPLAGHPGVNGAPHLPGPHHVLTSSASGVIGRPTSTPSTGTNAFNGKFVFSTLYRKFEAITHAKGQKTIFLEPFGRLIDLLVLYRKLCIFPCVCFFILITITAVEFFWIAKSWVRCCLTFFPLSPSFFLHLLSLFSYFCGLGFLLTIHIGAKTKLFIQKYPRIYSEFCEK